MAKQKIEEEKDDSKLIEKQEDPKEDTKSKFFKYFPLTYIGCSVLKSSGTVHTHYHILYTQSLSDRGHCLLRHCRLRDSVSHIQSTKI